MAGTIWRRDFERLLTAFMALWAHTANAESLVLVPFHPGNYDTDYVMIVSDSKDEASTTVMHFEIQRMVAGQPVSSLSFELSCTNRCSVVYEGENNFSPPILILNEDLQEIAFTGFPMCDIRYVYLPAASWTHYFLWDLPDPGLRYLTPDRLPMTLGGVYAWQNPEARCPSETS